MALVLPQSPFQLSNDRNDENSEVLSRNDDEIRQMLAMDTVGDRAGDIARCATTQSDAAGKPCVCASELSHEKIKLKPAASVVNDLDVSMDNAIDELLEDDDSCTYVESGTSEPMNWTTGQSTNDYGGLYNLGNTCYMASALQMLASLDGFVETLDNEKTTLDSNSNIEDRSVLRAEFVKLMKCINEGKTIQPDGFKCAMDSRTSLFVGFRQQDSHEFLTTLLDLLDEDYKGSPQTTQVQQPERRERSRGESLSGGSNLDNQLDDLERSESSSKRLRTEEPTASNIASSFSDHYFAPNIFSFSRLGVEDIGKLLHETHPYVETQSSFSMFSGPMSASEPKYKLVGGRMNTAEMILTRYTEENDPLNQHQPTMAAEADNASMETSTEGSSLPESPLAEYFTTEVRIRLTCDSCKFSRSHKEKFWHLSLEIGPDSGSVDEGIRRFFAPEKREIKCEKCFCSSATQTSEIARLPRALLLHFKRFIVDVSSDYSSVTYRKNQSPVVFDEELSLHDHLSVLTEFMAADCMKPGDSAEAYAIRSVVNHIGSSASCGHYTADSHRWYDDEKERKWTRFNDAYVSSISSTEALENSRETAYMVMYEMPSFE